MLGNYSTACGLMRAARANTARSPHHREPAGRRSWWRRRHRCRVLARRWSRGKVCAATPFQWQTTDLPTRDIVERGVRARATLMRQRALSPIGRRCWRSPRSCRCLRTLRAKTTCTATPSCGTAVKPEGSGGFLGAGATAPSSRSCQHPAFIRSLPLDIRREDRTRGQYHHYGGIDIRPAARVVRVLPSSCCW